MSLVLPPGAPFAPSDDPVRQLVESGPDMMVLLRPDGRCRYVSPASQTLLGRPPNALVGVDLRDVVLEADQHILHDLIDQLGAGASSGVAAFRVYGAYGTWIWMEVNAKRLPAGAGAVLVLRDITARKDEESVLVEANDLLRRRATLDPVTCLPNRGHFMAGLERETRRAQRETTMLALLAIGIDEMRLFNDFYGRDAGDLALREVAAAIDGALCRPGDQAGRLKGAMLGVLLPNTDLEGAASVAERLREAVTALKLEHAGGPTGRLTVTVGIACSEPRTRAIALLQEAVCELEVARAAGSYVTTM